MKNSILNAVCKMRYLALLVVLILTCGNAWADYASNFTDKNLSVGSGELTWSAFPAFSSYESLGSARGAQSAKASTNITITSANITGTITGIAVVGSMNGAGSMSVTVGGSSFGSSAAIAKGDSKKTYSFTGNATITNKAVVITVSRSVSATFWIKSISITTSSGGGSTCATPTFSPAAGAYCGSQSVTISSSTTGSTIYYTTDGSTPTTGSSHGTAGAANASVTVSSTQTLKAIAVKDGLTNSTAASASYTINNIANTQETAYTVAEARALIDANVCLTQQVYVKGYVSEIVTAFNGTYGNISFNITDNSDGTGDTFEFFRNFKGSGNKKWASAEEAPQVGNYVVGYGTLTKYSSTYELAEGNYCVVNSSYTITAISNNASYGTVSLTGKVITATPESGYRVSTTSAYTVTSGTATVTDNGDGTFTVTPSSDCMVQINFEAIPTHNIIFNTGGLVTISNATVYEGDTYNITETPAISGKHTFKSCIFRRK